MKTLDGFWLLCLLVASCNGLEDISYTFFKALAFTYYTAAIKLTPKKSEWHLFDTSDDLIQGSALRVKTNNEVFTPKRLHEGHLKSIRLQYIVFPSIVFIHLDKYYFCAILLNLSRYKYIHKILDFFFWNDRNLNMRI